jgi:peptide-methionine (S)-S-oxide reductase
MLRPSFAALVFGALLAAIAAVATPVSLIGGEPPMPNPPSQHPARTETATLAGGCFWCLEAVFKMIPGVISVTSGYTGGTQDSPTYEEVCTGRTGHAEAVQIVFDPDKLSYSKLLETFWECHDPTTLNRQGHDVGTQYRSAIFYHNDSQKAAAEASKTAEQKTLSAPIVTEIVPLKKFWPAEKYHHDYFANNPRNPYCSIVIRPKVDKIKAKLGREQ